MKPWRAATCLALFPGVESKKRRPAFCLSPPSSVLQHQQGLLRLGVYTARASFSVFRTQRTPQVYVRLGELSVCCCTAIGGSFAPHFISQRLGTAADSAAAAAATAADSGLSPQTAAAAIRASTAAPTRTPQGEIQKAIQTVQNIFVGQDALYFKACEGRREFLSQGCSVCFLGFLPFGLLSAFLGGDPALVLHAKTAAKTPESAAETVETDAVSSARVVGWPLGAPEAFRRQVERSRLKGEARQNYSPSVKAIGLYHLKDEQLNKSFRTKPSAAPFVPLASSLPDFAVQPLHKDVIGVVWGTASFWEVMPPDEVCALVGEFVSSQKPQDEDALLTRREEASEFLLRKALVQAAVNKEKSVKELVYHPAALHAAGLPHWQDSSIETERKAALGNRKAEVDVMRNVVMAQEEYLKRSKLSRSFSQQPVVDSDMGVLVLLFQR